MFSTESEVNLIESIKWFPNLYKINEDRTPCTSKAKAWESLANRMLLRPIDLQNQWRNMLYTYIKINISILNGDFEHIERLKKDSRMIKYFDGSLAFLDPHIDHIKRDVDISGYMQEIFYDDIETPDNKNDLMNTTKVTQEMVRQLLKTRKDEVTMNEDDMECILELVKASVDQILSKLTPRQNNTDATEAEDSQSTETQNINKGMNVEEKRMRKFCKNLADYAISRFSSKQQHKLRQEIASLVTDMERQK